MSVLVVLTGLVGLGRPGAADPLADARARLHAARAARVAAQQAADLATARYARLVREQAALADGIAATRRRIEGERRRYATLRALVAARAVAAYKGAGTRVPIVSDLGARSAADLIRRQSYLADANDRGMAEAEAARAAREDLEVSLAELEDARRRLDALTDRARAEAATISARLTAASRAEQQAQAALVAAEAARRAAEERRRAARPPTAAPTQPSPPSRPPAPPRSAPVRGLTCPVRGPISFTDDDGAARPGGRYLDAYAGGPRRVAQGEVVGYMGDTGSPGAVHTHFEIRPGGGRSINPYGTLRAIC